MAAARSRVARFSFEDMTDHRASIDAARRSSRLVRQYRFRLPGAGWLDCLAAFHRDRPAQRPLVARRIASVAQADQLAPDRDAAASGPTITLATLNPTDNLSTLVARVGTIPSLPWADSPLVWPPCSRGPGHGHQAPRSRSMSFSDVAARGCFIVKRLWRRHRRQARDSCRGGFRPYFLNPWFPAKASARPKPRPSATRCRCLLLLAFDEPPLGDEIVLAADCLGGESRD